MDDIISVKEAAKELGVSPRRMLTFIYDGRLPARKMGHDWVIQKQDLEPLRVRPTGRPKRKAAP